MTKIILIIPCFNEEFRLRLESFKNAPLQINFLFANDGSIDRTQTLLKQFCATNPRFSLFNSPKNLGKGNIIRAAYATIQNEYDWIGYWDADLATPLAEVANMLKYQEFYPDIKVDAIWCSRVARLGSHIKRDMHRHYLARILVTVISNVLKVNAYDSQCGAKLFRPEAARVAFAENFINRWIFDVEIFLRLKGFNIIEYPLLSWEDVSGSKLNVFREIFRILMDLPKIKKRYRSNTK
jgi:dolichyl-phosphate beta-glucosyltransferase